MKVFVTVSDNGHPLLMARAEGDDGMVGDMSQEVLPGSDIMGFDYEWWKSKIGSEIEVVD